MKKKVYLAPKAKVILLEATNAVLIGSGTGATGEDIPWAARRSMRNIDDDELFDEE